MSDGRTRLQGKVTDVPVAGGHLRVEQCGDGPALILLHGWTLDRRTWIPQLQLAEQLRLVTLDRRGFGQSTAPPDLAQEPADVLAVADALGLDRFALLGMSQAGRVAVHVARTAPERVCGLILYGTSLDGLMAQGDAEVSPAEAMRRAFQAGEPAKALKVWKAHPLAQLATAEGALLLDRILQEYLGRDLLQPAGELPLCLSDFARLDLPIHGIVGACDTKWRRRVAQMIAALRPDNLLASIKGAGHLANLDQPADFNQAVVRCLAGQTAGGPLPDTKPGPACADPGSS